MADSLQGANWPGSEKAVNQTFRRHQTGAEMSGFLGKATVSDRHQIRVRVRVSSRVRVAVRFGSLSQNFSCNRTGGTIALYR